MSTLVSSVVESVWKVAGPAAKAKTVRFIVSDNKEVVVNVADGVEQVEKQTKSSGESVVEDVMRHLFRYPTKNEKQNKWYNDRNEVLRGTMTLVVECKDCKAKHPLHKNSPLLWRAFDIQHRGKVYYISRYQCPACRPKIEAEVSAKLEGAKAFLAKARGFSVAKAKVGVAKLEGVLAMLAQHKDALGTPLVPVADEPKDESLVTAEGTVLHFHSVKAHAAVVQRLSAGGLIDATNETGQTALHLAARRGDVESVKALIRLGADEAKLDNKGLSVLHYAVLGGNVALVDQFMRHFAPNTEGETPLDYALTTPFADVVHKLLVFYPPVDSSFIAAARVGNVKGMVELTAAGGEPSDEAIVEAAKLGHRHAVDYMLAHGGSADARDSQGRTPLMLAVGNVNVGTFVSLLQISDLTATDGAGRTVVDYVKVKWMGKMLGSEEFTRTISVKADAPRDSDADEEVLTGAEIEAQAAITEEEMYREWEEWKAEQEEEVKEDDVV